METWAEIYLRAWGLHNASVNSYGCYYIRLQNLVQNVANEELGSVDLSSELWKYQFNFYLLG